jgi:hypothetical protein
MNWKNKHQTLFLHVISNSDKKRIEIMERKVDEKSKISSIPFEEVFKEIEKVKRLLDPPAKPKGEIGFRTD